MNLHKFKLSLASAIIFASYLCFTSLSLQAHEVTLTVVTLSETQADTDPAKVSVPLDLVIDVNLEALIARIGSEVENTTESPQSEHYNLLRFMPPEILEQEFESDFLRLTRDVFLLEINGLAPKWQLKDISIPATADPALERLSRLTFSVQPAENATYSPKNKISWGLGKGEGDSIIRVALPGSKFATELVKDGDRSREFTLGQVKALPWYQAAWVYLVYGFEHIVPKGGDHILFVVGLFLIAPFVRPLAWQVTAFTAAHSLTIALGVLDLVNISPSIVEPLIAASIIFVAVENIFFKTVTWWRTLLVFAFGLLHGLGFAGIISEIGLPDQQFILALLTFNIGVEFGQLAVLAVCFLAVGIWFRHKPFYASLIKIPGSLIIGFIATLWFLERTGIIAYELPF